MATKVNNDGILKALFFFHTKSVKLLTAYHQIILLDCTYKTNKYQMFLLHISGITGANNTLSMVFCFMAKETKIFYDWALKSLLAVFNSHDIPLPAFVITNQEQSLMKSLSTNFPNANLMLCAWHIQKNLLAKASKLIKDQAQEKEMLGYWSNLVKLQTQVDFPSSFNQFSTAYGPDFRQYVTGAWLPVAEHYSNGWTQNLAHFDNHTKP